MTANKMWFNGTQGGRGVFPARPTRNKNAVGEAVRQDASGRGGKALRNTSVSGIAWRGEDTSASHGTRHGGLGKAPEHILGIDALVGRRVDVGAHNLHRRGHWLDGGCFALWHRGHGDGWLIRSEPGTGRQRRGVVFLLQIEAAGSPWFFLGAITNG